MFLHEDKELFRDVIEAAAEAQKRPIAGYVQQSLISGVKMEVALGSISFPTLRLSVDSYVYQYLKEENHELVEEFQLHPFEMTLQSLERTFADKVFALCDYYMLKNTQRNSRHIYDLYMLMPKITLDDEYKKLVADIRKDRSKMTVCPSAQPDVNVSEILKEIIEGEIYRSDYEEITTYFQNHPVKYETAISVLYRVIESKIFE